MILQLQQKITGRITNEHDDWSGLNPIDVVSMWTMFEDGSVRAEDIFTKPAEGFSKDVQTDHPIKNGDICCSYEGEWYYSMVRKSAVALSDRTTTHLESWVWGFYNKHASPTPVSLSDTNQTISFLQRIPA